MKLEYIPKQLEKLEFELGQSFGGNFEAKTAGLSLSFTPSDLIAGKIE